MRRIVEAADAPVNVLAMRIDAAGSGASSAGSAVASPPAAMACARSVRRDRRGRPGAPSAGTSTYHDGAIGGDDLDRHSRARPADGRASGRARPYARTLGRNPTSPNGAALSEQPEPKPTGPRADGPRRGGKRRPPGPGPRRRRGRGLPRAGAPRAPPQRVATEAAGAAGHRRRPRLRQPVRAADRAARPRAERLLRAPAARHADGRARATRREGGDPVRRPVIGLRRRCAARRPGALVRPHPGARHLLRAAAHGARARRRGRAVQRSASTARRR